MWGDTAMKETNSTALLDTDFISKALTIRDGDKSLLDVILSLHGYDFCCHEYILNELGRHNPEMVDRVMAENSNGRIKLYSDEDVIAMLSDNQVFGFYQYLAYFREACDSIGSVLYESYRVIRPEEHTADSFISRISELDEKVERGSSLGEIKTFILLQTQKKDTSRTLYRFCSDDKNARIGARILVDNLRCISILSAFLWLKEEIHWTESEAQPYMKSYIRLCEKYSQNSFHVLSADNSLSVLRVPCEQVLHEIFDDRFYIVKNGFLRYISPDSQR